jgi:hypothetical protein
MHAKLSLLATNYYDFIKVLVDYTLQKHRMLYYNGFSANIHAVPATSFNALTGEDTKLYTFHEHGASSAVYHSDCAMMQKR